MGIPLYFNRITNTHKHLISPTKQKCDRLFLDFNGIIHTVFQKIKHEVDKKMPTETFEEYMNSMIISYTEEILSYVKPKELVYICIDGVAPLPKIQQQRKRRYLSTWLKSNLQEDGYVWDSNAISPGTKYMKKLNDYLRNYIKNTTRHFEIILSDSSQQGEGEHKIFDYIHFHGDTNYIDVIYGLDADLIMLSIICSKSKKYLLREPQHYSNQHHQQHTPFLWFNVDKFKESLLAFYNYKLDIHSYVFLCFLVGNDFLPNLSFLSIHNDGIQKIIDTYMRILEENNFSMKIIFQNTSDKFEINYDILTRIMEELCKREDDEMKTIHKQYYDKNMIFKTNKLKLENYGLFNKDNSCKQIFKHNNWRFYYYYNLFDTNNYSDNIICNVSESYVHGLQWTTNYYFNKEYKNNWYYSFNYSPTMLDVYNFLEVNKSKLITGLYKSCIPEYIITPDIQLLLILPKMSINILPEYLQKMISHDDMGYYYPIKFKIQTYLKTKLHECYPVLPTIDISHVQVVYLNMIS